MLVSVDAIGTAIFDEVDTGVGGAVAEVIGLELSAIAEERQVIVITHLAQIAAKASRHLLVEKETTEGRTRTSVQRLAPDARMEEVARMLGGLTITQRTREHAAELLGH